LIVDLVLGHRREEAEGLQGGDCLIVTHGALEGHGDPVMDGWNEPKIDSRLGSDTTGMKMPIKDIF
jgi:hypothetical protein